MSIDRKTIKKIASLARLDVSDQELELLTPELASIIGYFEKLQELDMEDVQPTSHVQEMKCNLREDEPRPSIPNEEALKNAPDSQSPFFRVPRVIEQAE